MIPVDRTGPLPLSFAQQRLWFIDQFEPGSPLYNIPFSLRLTGRLDVQAVNSSLNQSSPATRCFAPASPSLDGEPVQIIGDYQPFDLEVATSAQADPAAMTPAPSSSRSNKRGALRPSPAPCCASSFCAWPTRARPPAHVAPHRMRRLVAWPPRQRVLRALLGLLRAARCLPELPFQYADFALWQSDWLRGEALEEQLAYWRAQLDSLTTLELPTDFPRPAVASHDGAAVDFLLDEELTRSSSSSAATGVTLFMTLMAAFQALLSRYTGQTDIAVGTDIANRNRLETESLIGFFVNELVLRADLSADPTFVELLRQVRRTTLDAYAHQDLPFDKLVAELSAAARFEPRAPLPGQARVAERGRAALGLPDLQVSSLEEPHQIAKFDLTFVFDREQRRASSGALEFATDFFTRPRPIASSRTCARCSRQSWTTRPAASASLPLLTRRSANSCCSTLTTRRATSRATAASTSCSGRRPRPRPTPSRSSSRCRRSPTAARRAGEPVGPLPAGPGRRPRGPRGRLHAAVGRYGGSAARHAQVGRGLPAN